MLQVLPAAALPEAALPEAGKSPPRVSSADKLSPVQAALISDTSEIAPGSQFKLAVKLDIEPGWHTYYKIPGDSGMPTSIEWVLPPGFTASPLIWEKPTKFVEAGLVTYGYHDSSMLAAKIQAPQNIKGDLVFKAKVKWLACKEMCLPGKTELTLTVPASKVSKPSQVSLLFDGLGEGFDGDPSKLALESPGPNPGAIGANGAGSNSGKTAPISVLDQKFASSEKVDMLAIIGSALLGGFILNFMPCVLPVIAIKIMSFLEQAEEKPDRVRLLGAVFSGGIISSFMLLALIVTLVKSAGQSVGWGFQFQYPGFVVFMSVVVLLMALSLFGLFYVNVQVSGSLDKLSEGEGLVGTFFKGVLATVLSTPCTAPFLGTALGFAFSQPSGTILTIFLASSIGMSLPYLLLTINPTWLKFMPKPGAWMDKFKQSLGFILLATVVWLDSVLASQVGPQTTLWVNYWLVGVAFTAWIVASYTDLTSDTARKVKVYGMAAAIFLGITWLCIFSQSEVLDSLTQGSRAQAPLAGQSGEPAAANVSGASSSGANSSGINWLPFTADALNAELAAGHTVFLDFTANWCLTCKANELTVLSQSEIKDKMKALNVVTMKADWTKQDPDITKLLSNFGRSGVPLYVIFPGRDPGHPLVLPEVITKEIVLGKLDEAGKSR